MQRQTTNLKLVLEKTAKQYPGKTAIISGNCRMSYAELDEASNKIANALLAMRVKKGDRVAMLLGNSPEFICVYFGIIKSGAIAVPMDNRYRVNELVSVCGNCRPKVIAAESPILESLLPAFPAFDYVENVIAVNPASEGQFVTYQQIMETGTAQRPRVALTPDDIATISYSGGPAIHPKGVMLTQHSLVTEAIASGNAFGQSAEDVVMLFALPLYHMYGLSAVGLTSIHKGSTIVVVPGTGVSIGTLMEAIEQEKGTMLHAVPYIYSLATTVAKREGIRNNLSSLRLCISGGAPLPVSTIEQFKQYYGLTIVDIYGMTEAVCQVSCPPLDGTAKIGATGKALRGFEIKIVDDDGNELPAGQSGEIVVRGHIMKGYYNNPQATALAIRNGWLHTGDTGKLDKDGYLFITGRKKRMVILKGQNVYPAEIEEVLSAHPKIAQTKVIGVPDPLRGEVVRAYIRLKAGETATEQEIRHFCQELMADYRVPREMIFTDVLPEAATARAADQPAKSYLPKTAEAPSSSPSQ